MQYNQFSNSSSYFPEKYSSKNQLARPLSTYYDTQNSNEKSNAAKSLRWNIEGSKENFVCDQKPNFAATFSHNDQVFNKTYSKKLINFTDTIPLKQEKKIVSSKSYKTITFTSQLQREYEKEKNIYEKNDYSNRNKLKDLTTSISHHNNANDFLRVPSYNRGEINLDSKLESYKDDRKKMMSSKSQKHIKYQIQDNFRLKPQYKPQDSKYEIIVNNITSSPSSKNIKLDSTYKDELKGANISSYPSSKSIKADLPSKEQIKGNNIISYPSYKNIKPEYVRPKTEKIASYCQQGDSTQSVEKIYPKKHQTVDILKGELSHECSKPKISLRDFQLGKCKGEGAFGQVFPAFHKATRMLVAIKKVPKEKVKYMLEQFINEIKIQLFLDHQNIVKLYGFFDDSTNFYIIMEYMEGGNLFGLLKKQKRLSESQAIEQLKEVCIGLKEMHDNSIIHRDIKPENIVITNGVSKLCDFGWAAILKDRRTTYCGTLDYVSPEIIEGQGYDDSVDIWCIGVLAYQLLCGKTPFYNISRQETTKKILKVNYDYPSDISISSRAKAFIDKILKKNPEERIGIDQVLRDKFLNP